MKNTQIKFLRNTNFTGRNGFMQCSGIDLFSSESYRGVILSPLTSRGVVGRCDVVIPSESIPDLINALLMMTMNLKPKRIRRKRGEHRFNYIEGTVARCVTCGLDEDDCFTAGEQCVYGQSIHSKA